MSGVTILAVLVFTGCLAVFLYAVRRRWLSRLERGFLLTLMLALVGLDLAAASLLGMWGYEASRDMLFQQTVHEMESVGALVEAGIHHEITLATAQLTGLAETMATALGQPRQDLRHELADIERVQKRFLQINLIDKQGALVVSSSVKSDVEPVNRVGVAFNLEGKPFASDAYVSPVFKRYVVYLSVPIRDSRGALIGAVTSRYDLQDSLVGLISTTRFDTTGYTALTNGEGRVLAHPDTARINDDLSTYPAVHSALQGRSGWAVAKNKAGHERLMVYRPVKSPATVSEKPWVLLTEIDTGEALAPIHALRNEFLLGVLVFAVACLLVASQVGRYVSRPLQDLLSLATRVREGDLSARAPAEGRDELCQLASALNDMVRGLQERERIKEVFGRYVTTQVSEEILKGEISLGGESRRVSMLFSDIRNFTTMAETMTPVQVVAFLNDYFSEMVEAVFEQGGVLDKFIGDGMLAVFGSIGDELDHPRRAVLTALRMKARLAKINGERETAGLPPVAIGIGVHTDEVIVGNIGSIKRLEYTVIGDGVNTCSRVEALNKEFGTTILITETTYEAVRDEFECRAMPEAKVKGKATALRVYEVLRTRAR